MDDETNDLVVDEPTLEDVTVNVRDIDNERSSNDETVPGWQMLNKRMVEARAKYRRGWER